MYPLVLQKTIDYLKLLPSIGEKTAERMVLSLLELDDEIIEDLSKNLSECKKVLKPCKICGHLTDQEICNICSDDNRDKSLICVLEDYKSVFNFEKNGNYNGTYHVLNGLISPIENITPEDININSLLKRIDENENCEIILALKSNIEGETTTLYIKKILEKKNVIVSRLSYGIPMGAEIDYLDSLTLNKAIEDRKTIS